MKGKGLRKNKKGDKMKTKKPTETVNKDYEGFLEALELSGGIICGTIGCGKTNLAKHIAKSLIIKNKKQNVLFRIFDVTGGFFFKFGVFPSQIINTSNDLPIRAKVVVYYLKMDSEEERRRFLEKVLKYDLECQKALHDEAKGDSSKYRVIYNIIEESNTILSTYAIKKGFFRDFVAFSRNFNIRNVYIMQRLADSSTKVTERIPNLAIGQTIGANDKRRIKAIIESDVNFGEKWRFQLYYDGKLHSYNDTLFEGKQTVRFYITAKTMGIWHRNVKYETVRAMDDDFASHSGSQSSKKPYFEQSVRVDDLDEEMELDLALLGEPDEEW